MNITKKKQIKKSKRVSRKKASTKYKYNQIGGNNISIDYKELLLPQYKKLSQDYKAKMGIGIHNPYNSDNSVHELAINSLLKTSKFSEQDISVLNSYKSNGYQSINKLLWVIGSKEGEYDIDELIKSLELNKNTFKNAKHLYNLIKDKGYNNENPFIVFRNFSLFGNEEQIQIEFMKKLKDSKQFDKIQFNGFLSTSATNPISVETMSITSENPYAIILLPKDTKFIMYELENELLLNPGTLIKLGNNKIEKNLGLFLYSPELNNNIEKYLNLQYNTPEANTSGTGASAYYNNLSTTGNAGTTTTNTNKFTFPDINTKNNANNNNI